MRSDNRSTEKTRNSSNQRFSSKPNIENMISNMTISPSKEGTKSKRVEFDTQRIVNEEYVTGNSYSREYQ